jgi:hypothetical protein
MYQFELHIPPRSGHAPDNIKRYSPSQITQEGWIHEGIYSEDADKRMNNLDMLYSCLEGKILPKYHKETKVYLIIQSKANT